jgi:hypothetical protein
MQQHPCTVSALLVLCLLLATVTVAKAQDTGAAVDMTGMYIYSMEEAVKEAARTTTSGAKSTSPSVKKQAAKLAFTPSTERRRQNLTQFAAKVRAKDAKQVAEACLVQAVIIGSALEQAKNDPSQLKALAGRMEENARSMGLDLSAMDLTNSGFRSHR